VRGKPGGLTGEKVGKTCRRIRKTCRRMGRTIWKACGRRMFRTSPRGAIVGLIIGIIIILVGLSQLPGIDFGKYIWPLIIIVFGILILAGALYGYSRRS